MNFTSLNFSKKTPFIFIIPSIMLFSCCTTNSGSKSVIKKESALAHTKVFNIKTKDQQQTVYFGEKIEFDLESKKNIPIDSLSVNLDKKNIRASKLNEQSFSFQIPNESAGRKSIQILVYFSDTLSEQHTLKAMFLPKESPQIIKYKVIRSFPHDPEAYTQGLLYHDNFLYESTGQNNRSSVRKINPVNGEVLRRKGLAPQYFGEGICLYNNELFMLTYKAQKVFVFDLETFEEKRNYNLQTREGWGITYNGKDMIMSDGSAYLYFFDPEYFTLHNQIEVCDNQGLMDSLNELEITPYGLFANIYTKNNIVLIDIEKSIIKGILDLSALVPENLPHNADYVLNGIAYNEKTNTFYVTGKQWPVMFEIELSLDL